MPMFEKNVIVAKKGGNMQISARYQAVYEILTEIFKDLYPADRIINEYLRARKYIGSKDRRFITDTVWDIIRHRFRLEFAAQSKDVRKILLVYLKNEDFEIVADGSAYGLASLSVVEKRWLKGLSEREYPPYIEHECPQWLYEKINNFRLLQMLNKNAPADLRVNMASRDEIKRRLQAEGLFFAFTPYSPYGLRSEERINLNNCVAYQEGLVEVQDEASQVAALLCDVSPDEKVVDYCAGAGGKSLAISAYNRSEGAIQAYDKNWNRMDVIKKRAERLGIRNIKLVTSVEDLDYDCFIVDAPCSGSGTWRRSPDAKFRLTPEKISELNSVQTDILEFALRHVRKGGKIVYMTCSILADENENIVENFVNRHADVGFVDHEKLWQKKLDMRYPFAEKRFIHFSPLATNTDGFFFCMMEKLSW